MDCLLTLKAVGMDTLAEWLRRRPAKPMGSPCVGSNPTGVVFRDQLCEHEAERAPRRCPVAIANVILFELTKSINHKGRVLTYWPLIEA